MTHNRHSRSVRVGNRISSAASACAWLLAWAFLAARIPALLAAGPITPEAADSCRVKLRSIQNGVLADSNAPIQFSEQEANSYLALDLARSYPGGVSAIELEFRSGRIAGTAQVDFDQLKKFSRRPLPAMVDLLLFGRHQLMVEGALTGVNGQGRFKLVSVALDGIPMPQMLLDVLIDYFLKQRFPGLDLDAPFRLPHSIDRLSALPGRIEVAGSTTVKL